MRWISQLGLDLHEWLSDQELPSRAFGRKSVFVSIPVGNCTAYIFLSIPSYHAIQSRRSLVFNRLFFLFEGENLQLPSMCARTWGRSATVRWVALGPFVCIDVSFSDGRRQKSPMIVLADCGLFFFRLGDPSEQALPLHSCMEGLGFSTVFNCILDSGVYATI